MLSSRSKWVYFKALLFNCVFRILDSDHEEDSDSDIL